MFYAIIRIVQNQKIASHIRGETYVSNYP